MLNTNVSYSNSAASRSTPQEAARDNLGLAQSYIAEGNTTAALQVVFETLRTFCGNTAAQSAATRVESQLLHLHLQPQGPSAQSAADQLADILTGCRIGDTQREQLFPPQPASLDADMQQLHLQTQPMQNGQDQQPLLMELRGMHLAEPGVQDESSFVCQHCGGIVSRSSQAEVSPPICYVQLGLSTISPDLLLQVKEPKPTDLELA